MTVVGKLITLISMINDKMKKFYLSICCLLLCVTVCFAQKSESVPDIKYHTHHIHGLGINKWQKLSEAHVLYTILYFGSDANPEYSALESSDSLKPYYNNYNPDYGFSLMLLSSMKNQKRTEKQLGVSSYPDIVLLDPKRRIIARSNKASDIIEYITTHLSMFSTTDWNMYILTAKKMYESGQTAIAQNIVRDCLMLYKWDNDFSPEAHKAIPMIVASMKDDEYYTSCVAEIKLRYQKGILSKEDIAPFEYLFPSVNLGPEIHL